MGYAREGDKVPAQGTRLNEYEVRAYLTLIRNGPPLTAGELATLSKVPPQPRIYDVIRTLMAKGFVTTSEGGRPKQVVPINPNNVMNAMKRRYTEKIDALKTALEKLYTPPKGEIGSVTVVKSRITLEDYIRQAIKRSRFHLSIAVPHELLGGGSRTTS